MLCRHVTSRPSFVTYHGWASRRSLRFCYFNSLLLLIINCNYCSYTGGGLSAVFLKVGSWFGFTRFIWLYLVWLQPSFFLAWKPHMPRHDGAIKNQLEGRSNAMLTWHCLKALDVLNFTQFTNTIKRVLACIQPVLLGAIHEMLLWNTIVQYMKSTDMEDGLWNL